MPKYGVYAQIWCLCSIMVSMPIDQIWCLCPNMVSMPKYSVYAQLWCICPIMVSMTNVMAIVGVDVVVSDVNVCVYQCASVWVCFGIILTYRRKKSELYLSPVRIETVIIDN